MESKNNCYGLIECKDVLSFGIFNFTVICYGYAKIFSFVLMQKTIIFAKNLNRYGTGKTKC